jgi:hypothetical protein
MPNIVTNNLKISNAKNFKDSVSQDSGSSLYMFLAKPNPWPNDEVPDPQDVQDTQSKIWDEIISLKRILPNSIINVVRRINWTLEETYAEYDHEDTDLLSKPFYVLNKEFNVYKCISNNFDNPSKIEPTGKSLDITTLSDGYRWKYLYTISTSDQLKFLTQYWMPVLKDVTVSSNAKDGAIEHVKIYNGGLDYSTLAEMKIIGDGTGAVIKPKLNLGVIYDFVYQSYGTGYRYANAYITDYSGSTGKYASIKAIINPQGGHGFDPVLELGAHYLMINVRTDYNEGYGDFPAGFTFRQLGIIKNPIAKNGFIAEDITMMGLDGLLLSNVSGVFRQNEYIEGTTSLANAYIASANIVSNIGTVNYVQSFGVTKNFDKFKIGENVVGTVSGATASVSNLLYAEVLRNKGDIFYVENRTPITRSSNQTDNLHLVIEF